MTADECLTGTEQDVIIATIAQLDRKMLKEELFDLIKRFIVMSDPQCWNGNDTINELATEATQDFINKHRSIVESSEDGKIYLFVDPATVGGSLAARQENARDVEHEEDNEKKEDAL